MKRLFAIPLVLVAMVFAAIYFSGAASTSSRADFSFVNRGENRTLDVHNMSYMQDIRLAYALWEGLYALDPVTLKPIPGTADKIDLDPTHTIYTFHIRADAKWTNGQPVTANDFVFEWRRMLEDPSDYSYLFSYIKNATAYEKEFAQWSNFLATHKPGTPGSATPLPPNFSTVGIVARDPHTLVVTLATPVAFFPALCAFPAYFPMYEPAMRPFAQTVNGVTTYKEECTRPPNLVTNGAYRLESWQFKRRLRMVASQYYWDRKNVHSKTIDEINADDGLAAYRLYQSNEVDWLADVDADIAGPVFARGGRDDLHVFPAFGTYFYSLNCLPNLPDGTKNPLADVRVRQALAMSIDKQPIVDEVGRLGQPVASTYIPQHAFDGYKSPPGLPYDVAAAKKLLAAAGYPDGHGFPSLSILYNTEANHGDVAQIIRRQWLANLGIDVRLDGVELKSFSDRLRSQKYSIARASWFGDYDDPSTFTDKYKTASENNDAKWSSKKYDALCAQAQIEPDPAKRLAEVAAAENILLNEAPIIPLYQYVNCYMFRTNVTGIPLHANPMIIFKSVKVER